ncbi:(R)-limonene synthase, putative [Ricinus communis]|uniref:(R)-limonene synthase, putative n=1 Tax=Ricinus communis TaxID=3988 RepID=B9S893_RICCO|nr:(R)-limonene synthase, putative [Ricinus communis]
MENFLWTVGENSELQFGYFRRMSTKINSLITIIDDIYEVYGTLDELELFTDAIERWDVDAMDQLPDYMKLGFLALHNSINEMAYDVLKKQGFYIIPYLKKAWADLCKSYLVEAKWYYSGYTPTLQEYMDNAWISISAPVNLVHTYFLEGSPITNEALKCMKDYPDIIRWSAIILRFANDLGTSSDSGSKDQGTHWTKWQQLCMNRKEGGLRTRHLQAFNHAFLAKQGWCLIQYPNSLCSSILKASVLGAR